MATSESCTLLLAGSAASRDPGRALHLYLRHGPEELCNLEGIFALALWDERRATLTCVRDRMGLHPLYYARVDGALLVSPDLDQLRRHEDVPAELDDVVLACHLCDVSPEPDQTFYRGVKRLPGGHALRAQDGALETFRYWRPTTAEAINNDPGSLLDRLEHVIREVIDTVLDQGPVGVFLSGGVDSALVAAIAAERAGERGMPPPLALSLAYPDPSCNEEPTQRALASALGMPHTVLTFDYAVGSLGIVKADLRLNLHAALPLLTPSALVAFDALAQAAEKQGVHSLVTGNGGDEWLVANVPFAEERFRSGDLLAVARFWRARGAYYPMSARERWKAALWSAGLRPLARGAAIRTLESRSPRRLEAFRHRRFLAALPPWLLPDANLREAVIDRALAVATDRGTTYESARWRTLTSYRGVLYLEADFHRLRNTGIRMLHPLHDARLVEFLFSLPPELLNWGGRAKGLAYALLARKLPEAVRDRPRPVYYDKFWQRTLTRELAPAWRALGSPLELARRGVVDEVSLQSSVEEVSGAALAEALQLCETMNLEAWARSRYVP